MADQVVEYNTKKHGWYTQSDETCRQPHKDAKPAPINGAMKKAAFRPPGGNQKPCPVPSAELRQLIGEGRWMVTPPAIPIRTRKTSIR